MISALKTRHSFENGLVFKATLNESLGAENLKRVVKMPNILSDVNKRTLAELLDNYNALPWYKKLFYPGALSAALRQYDEAPSYDSAITVSNAYLKKTWFFQRWFFSSLVSFSSSGFITPTLEEALPAEMVLKIGEKLSFQEKARLACTSKYYHRLFQPELRAARLLLLVVRGQQDEAHAMLGQHPEWLLTPGDVTDYSGRTFRKITAYEYTYWAKDTHMCRMLEVHMDVATKSAMLKRINAMEKNGLTYEQHGVVVEHSKHFDFTPLITALTRYVQGFNNWYATGNWNAMSAAWMAVGMAQREMPVHVVNEYCRPDRSFDPLPEFNEESLPRSVRFYNFEAEREQSLFPLAIPGTSGLGVDFAIRREAGSAVGRRRGGPGAGVAAGAIDLAAVSCLDEIRTVDLTRSRENLEQGAPDHGLWLS